MIKIAVAYTLFSGSALNLMLVPQIQGSWKDYALNYLYTGGIYFPASYFTVQGLNILRRKLFTEFTEYQMQNFSLMYFISKPALCFDLFFQHFLFQGAIALSLFMFCENLYSKQLKPTTDYNKCIKDLITIRAELSLASVVIDLWLPQAEIFIKNHKVDPKEILQSKAAKTVYLVKHNAFTIFWHYMIISTYMKCTQEPIS